MKQMEATTEEMNPMAGKNMITSQCFWLRSGSPLQLGNATNKLRITRME
jgi:hypothetical protein